MSDSVTPRAAACQACLSFTISWSLLRFMSFESVMPSNHLIVCHPPLLLPSIFTSIRVFSNKSALSFRWPKFWSFSFIISPSNEYSGFTSFPIGWFALLAVQGTLESLLQNHRYCRLVFLKLGHASEPPGLLAPTQASGPQHKASGSVSRLEPENLHCSEFPGLLRQGAPLENYQRPRWMTYVRKQVIRWLCCDLSLMSVCFISECVLWVRGFPGGSDGKASARNVGDPGSIPGSGRAPGEGNGNALQYSCLENPMARGAWKAIVHGIAELDMTE